MIKFLLNMTVATASGNWDVVTEEDDGITVWRRDVEGSSLPELRAEMIVNEPADKVWRVVSTVEEYKEFMPYIVEIRMLDEDEDGTKYIYFRVEPPLVSARDYVMKTTFQPEPDKGQWLRSWTLANDKGPPVPDGVVRLQLNNGSWHLEKLGSRSTKVTYQLHTDPGGSIPSWIARKANTTSLPDLMRAVRARSKDPNWKPD